MCLWAKYYFFSTPFKLLCAGGMMTFSLLASAQFELLDYLEKAPGTEKKKITSERSPDRNYTKWRAFTQNNFTYFNFYFNTHDRFDDLMSEALKQQQKKPIEELESPLDDYNLDYMTSQKTVLDSIIVKCKAGVLLHDLRGKWIDDLLLLMGKCYFFEQRYDTAFTFFQYLNNAYKTEDGIYDDQTIYLDQPTKKYSIFSFERQGKRNQKARNDALVWEAKTLSAMGESNAAFSILHVLSKDPYLPARLKPDVLVAQAYAYYKNGEFADAAITLELLYGKYLEKRKLNEEETRKLLLISHLYEKGLRYHDAYRIYVRLENKTKNRYAAMYAKAKSVGLDYQQYITEQVAEAVHNRRYKIFAPQLYFLLAEKLYKWRHDALGTIIPRAIKLLDKMELSQQRKLQLMAISYYISHDQYLEASEILYNARLGNVSLEESKAYDLGDIHVLNELILKHNRIVIIDSLLKLSHLSAGQMAATISKLKHDFTKKKGVSSIISEKKQDKESTAWYFDNDYLLIKGKQEFVGRFGNIRDLDLWRNAPIVQISQMDYPTYHKKTDEQDDKLRSFLYSIPTVESARKKMYDSLFFSLGDFVFFEVNNFGYNKSVASYLKRALDLELQISSHSTTSAMLGNLKQLNDLVQKGSYSFLRSSLLRSNNARSQENTKDSVISVYQKATTDFLQNHFSAFLQDTYDVKQFSPLEKQHYLFMRASSFLKSNQTQDGIKLLEQLLKDQTTEEQLRLKVNAMLEYLKQSMN